MGCDLSKRTITVRRLKGSTDSVHYLERDERGAGELWRAKGSKSTYVFVNERGHPWAHGHCPNDRAGWRGRQAAIPGPRSHAAPFDRIRVGWKGNGYQTPPALPRACQHNQYGALHRDEPGAVQRHLALILFVCRGCVFQMKAHNASITSLVPARTVGEGHAARSNIPSAGWHRRGSRTSSVIPPLGTRSPR